MTAAATSAELCVRSSQGFRKTFMLAALKSRGSWKSSPLYMNASMSEGCTSEK